MQTIQQQKTQILREMRFAAYWIIGCLVGIISIVIDLMAGAPNFLLDLVAIVVALAAMLWLALRVNELNDVLRDITGQLSSPWRPFATIRRERQIDAGRLSKSRK